MKAYVFPGCSDQSVVDMLIKSGYDAELVRPFDTNKYGKDADFVVFTGGADVHPSVYGEVMNGSRGCDQVRDEYEVAAYEFCLSMGIPMVGICRGGQLLNAMNGGQMIQHLGKTVSGVVDTEFGPLMVDHHQGFVPDGADYVELVWANSHRVAYVAVYDESKCFCYQPHPEWQHEPTKGHFIRRLDRFLTEL